MIPKVLFTSLKNKSVGYITCHDSQLMYNLCAYMIFAPVVAWGMTSSSVLRLYSKA